jgi:hypothetical protein
MAKFPVNLSTLQTKFGTMNTWLHENKAQGLPRTMYYDIVVPIQKFHTALKYEIQPVETKFELGLIPLPFQDWRMLQDEMFSFDRANFGGNLYVGNAHNPLYLNSMHIMRKDSGEFSITCSLLCDFEFQSEWENEEILLNADIAFKGLVIDSRNLDVDLTNIDAARKFLAQYTIVDGYILNPTSNGVYRIFPPNWV